MFISPAYTQLSLEYTHVGHADYKKLHKYPTEEETVPNPHILVSTSTFEPCLQIHIHLTQDIHRHSPEMYEK